MITLSNIRRAIYNICKRLDILERNSGSGGSSTPVDISGKQDKIDSLHKLDSDLVSDSNQTNKFVTSQEKQNWNKKSDFSGDYDDLSNKPTLFSGSYNDLSNKPTIPQIWSGTQAQYDNLSSYDPNTIYIINN